jgi:hypothetical protein
MLFSFSLSIYDLVNENLHRDYDIGSIIIFSVFTTTLTLFYLLYASCCTYLGFRIFLNMILHIYALWLIIDIIISIILYQNLAKQTALYIVNIISDIGAMIFQIIIFIKKGKIKFNYQLMYKKNISNENSCLKYCSY